LAKLPYLSLPVSSALFFNIDAPYNRRYDYCVLIRVILFFRLGVTLVLINSFPLLQKTIELPLIGHLMEGFLQLPTLGCCVTKILMVLTIFVLVSEVGWRFDGLRSPEH